VADIELSVVIPVWNEVDNVVPLAAELQEALAGRDYEIIFVDDYSTDGTFDRLRELHAGDRRIKAARLRSHMEKTAALMAGFRLSRGQAVVTMDGDLQDVPGEIPKLLAALEGGMDLACGWRERRADSAGKRLQSVLFNWAVRTFGGVDVHDINCGFKAYRHSVVDALYLTRNQHRVIPALVARMGFRVGEVAVLHRPRGYGRSKYGPGRMLVGVLDFARLVLTPRQFVVKSRRLLPKGEVANTVGELLD
jgi:glycosyltransferase involved in cell wall biosynthesis